MHNQGSVHLIPFLKNPTKDVQFGWQNTLAHLNLEQN